MNFVQVLVRILVIVALVLDHVTGQEFETTNGRVRGRQVTVLGKSLDVFHGIPFAKVPIGDLRFKYPQPAEPWRPEVKDATREKPSCIQPTGLYDTLEFKDIRRPPVDFSEDCLYLSIWKPSSANTGSNLAVMVWIYGGGFSTGSTRVPVNNGQYLAAENDVIVVSVSYRVGPLGFSYLGPDTIPGNMGFMDQKEGMTWVKNNIGYFGGDTTRITIFGESAGAFSVGYHLTSPLSKDLFNNAILQSGVPVHSTENARVLAKVEVRSSVMKLSSVLNCSHSSDADIFNCLKAADAQSITSGFNQVSQLGMKFYPVEDGYFFPRTPITLIERGDHKKTNILLGVNKDETTLFFKVFLNTRDKTLKSTGEEFGHQHFQQAIASVTGVSDKGRRDALKYFYESEKNPPLDYLQVLNQLTTDFLYNCPSMLFSSLYAQTNDVYLYSLDHRISTMTLPEWMGVPHAYDLDIVFGMPLNESYGFTLEEQEFSRTVMKYWTNFAKSGAPNSPVDVNVTWPHFSQETKTYMALDVGSNLANRQGFHRHQCAFVNDILPMIPKDGDASKPVTSDPDLIYPVSGGRRQCSGCVSSILSLLTIFIWMRQR